MPDTTENRAEPWLDVSSLVVEVTRRCNLKCEHCLRGDAEDMDMDPELMATFLKNVKHVGEVTFSGGEPSINLQAIRSFYRICDEYGIPVDGFFVATNGVANQAELCLLLLEQYARLDNHEACGVALSRDMFHDGSIWRDLGIDGPSPLVRGLAFYTEQKEHHVPNDLSWITPEGRAYDNGLADVSGRTSKIVDFSFEKDRDGVSADTLYLSANGMLYPDCNLSYQNLDYAVTSPADCPVQSIPVNDDMKQAILAMLP